MRGPYLLRPLQVDISVPTRVGGVYCLGKSPREVRFVGAAERNLREAIKSHWKMYEFFWYRTTLSMRECYSVQCQMFHKQMNNGGLDVTDHPVAPPGVDEKCPVCGK